MMHRHLVLSCVAWPSAGALLFLSGCQPTPAVVSTTTRIAVQAAEEAAGGGFGSHQAEVEARKAEKPDKDELRDTKQVLADAYAGGETPNVAKWTPLKQLTPVQSGEGVIVFEPVSRGADSSTTEFAAGCSNWLELALGGQPELGKSPLIITVQRVRTELGKKDLRLEPADAVKLAALTGATRAVVTEVSGNFAQCTLTFQLYEVPGGKPLGKPLQYQGAAEALPARLPEVVSQLAVALGMKKPQIPQASRLRPDELALLGRFMYRSPNAQELAQLETLGPRDPLAALLLVDSGQAKSHRAALKSLMTQAGQNPLVLGHIGYVGAESLVPYRAQIVAQFQQQPRNYALAHTNVWLNRVLHRPNSERAATEMAVRSAPKNPEAWLSLGWTTSSVANTVRKGRVYAAMDGGEQALIECLYAEWLQAVYRAAQLDPQFGRAWDRVAQAATFAGNEKLATQAFWEAAKYSADKEALYGWGLQMFQPKWLDDANNLNRVVDLALKEKYPSYRTTLDMALHLADAGFKPQADTLRQRVMDECSAVLKRDPQSLEARWYLGVAKWEQGQLEEASLELQALAQAHPDEAKLQKDLGELMDQRQRPASAIKYYRQFLKLRPGDPDAHYSLGWDLKHTGQLVEAEKELREALRLKPDLGGAHSGLAQIAVAQHRNEEAARRFKEAVRLNPYDSNSELGLSIVLSQLKQYDEAILHAKRVAGMRPKHAPAWGQLGYLYAVSGKPAAAVEACRVALRLDANDAISRDNLGQALYESGKKAEGLAELRRVLTMGNEVAAKDARDYLAKHPQ